MEDYKYDGTNITTLRLVDNTKPAVAHIMRKIERSYRDKYGYSQPHIKLGVGGEATWISMATASHTSN